MEGFKVIYLDPGVQGIRVGLPMDPTEYEFNTLSTFTWKQTPYPKLHAFV
jgi:hypothetical protein